MARVTTLTSKGQVTVPKEIRDALGLKPRDKVEIFVKDGTAWLRKVDSSLDGVARGIPARDVSPEEWDEIVEDEVARHYAETES